MLTRSVLPLVALSFLVGCPPEVSDKVGGGSLLSTTEEPPGENCANGGTMVQSGMDSNGDGTLQDDEVTSTSYICNGENGQDGATGSDGQNGNDGNDGATGNDGADGSDGANAIIKLTNLAPGAECAAGGVQVDAGVDDNGDGVLQPSEVDSTTYVCNGEDGAQGQKGDPGQSSGDAALVSVADEPAGANCQNGGVAIATGVDSNGNGTLDSSEVDQTVYVCDGDAAPTPGTVIEGSYTIENSYDAAQLAGVQKITGTLSITGNGFTSVSLPDLQEVGSLEVASTDLQTLDLPALTTIDDSAYLSGGSMPDWTTFNIPVLTTIGGILQMYGDTLGWTDLSAFSNLNTLGGIYLYSTPLTSLDGILAITALPDGIYLNNNTSLTDINGLSNVTTAGDLYLGNFQGTDINLPNLMKMGLLTAYSAPIVSLELPALTEGGIDAEYCYSLATVDLSSLTTATELRFDQPSALTSLQAPNLTTSGPIYVYYDYALTTLEFPQLTTLTGDFYINYTSVTDLNFPLLSSAKSFTVYSSYSVANLDLSGLVTSNDIYMDSTALTTIDLPSLTTAGSIYLSSNNQVTDINIPAVTTAQNISLQYNYDLATLDLSALTTANSVYLYGENYLTSLDLPALTSVDTLTVYDTNITSISGFANLKTLNYLQLNYNYNLVTVTGFDQLTSLSSFYAYYNPYMTTIGGFGSLNQLDSLYLDSNYDLDDISGLLNANAGTYGTFYYNYSLCDSKISAYSSNTGASITSYANQSGC